MKANKPKLPLTLFASLVITTCLSQSSVQQDHLGETSLKNPRVNQININGAYKGVNGSVLLSKYLNKHDKEIMDSPIIKSFGANFDFHYHEEFEAILDENTFALDWQTGLYFASERVKDASYERDGSIKPLYTTYWYTSISMIVNTNQLLNPQNDTLPILREISPGLKMEVGFVRERPGRFLGANFNMALTDNSHKLSQMKRERRYSITGNYTLLEDVAYGYNPTEFEEGFILSRLNFDYSYLLSSYGDNFSNLPIYISGHFRGQYDEDDKVWFNLGAGIYLAKKEDARNHFFGVNGFILNFLHKREDTHGNKENVKLDAVFNIIFSIIL